MENLSWRLAPSLSDLYPGSEHVDRVGFHGTSDEAVWEFAKSQGHVIASKDADFYQRSVAYGPPPKVVWLRIGNGPPAVAERVLREEIDLVGRFGADPDAGFLVLPR